MTRAELGMLPGLNAPDSYATRWDPREDFKDPGGVVEDPWPDWGRETADGIELWRHPEVLILGPEFERERQLLDAWRAGVAREIPWSLYSDLSEYAITGWSIIRSAHAREELRRLKVPRGEGEPEVT